MKNDNKKIELKENNTPALLGFIFSLTGILAIPGLILSIIGLSEREKYRNKRYGLGVAGASISSILLIISIVLVIINIPTDNEIDNENNKTVCVTFMTDDSEYTKKCGNRGFKVKKPDDPQKDGYEFKYWSIKKDSADESDKYYFYFNIKEDTTLYAVFNEKPVTPSTNNQSTNNSVPQVSRYETIYNDYSNRLRSECPSLSITECAEIANEGVSKMAEYMYSASGTEGQYATYESWATKLYDVYLESAR